MIAGHALAARALGEQLGLADGVLVALASCYERWDGHGYPGELSGGDVPLVSRITQLAEFMEVAHRAGGVPAAVSIAERRSGKQFDPAIVSVVCTDAEKVFHGIEDVGSWDAVIDAEPVLARPLTPTERDEALAAVGRFVDLKSPYTLGHSTAVADLAADAGKSIGMPEADISQVRRVASVLGLGRLGVSNAIWDKRGPLTASEWERVRLHPYLTERMLEQSRALAPIGRLAAEVRERLDGSGYPRGLAGASIPRTSRVLAVADAYQAMREPRPHRSALGGEEAAQQLRSEADGGRLDGEAVEAVLGVAGHRVARRQQRARRPHPPGDRGAAPDRTRALQQASRHAARDLRQDRRIPRREHLHEDREVESGCGQHVRGAARPPARRRRALRRPKVGAVAAASLRPDAIRHRFLVLGAFQALNAAEARHHFGLPDDACELVLLTPPQERSAAEARAMIEATGWANVREIGPPNTSVRQWLRKVRNARGLRDESGPLDHLFLGDYQMQLGIHAAHGLDAGELVVLDDGLATIRIAAYRRARADGVSRPPRLQPQVRPSRLAAQRILARAIGLELGDPTGVTFFTVYDIDPGAGRPRRAPHLRLAPAALRSTRGRGRHAVHRLPARRVGDRGTGGVQRPAAPACVRAARPRSGTDRIRARTSPASRPCWPASGWSCWSSTPSSSTACSPAVGCRRPSSPTTARRSTRCACSSATPLPVRSVPVPVDLVPRRWKPFITMAYDELDGRLGEPVERLELQ